MAESDKEPDTQDGPKVSEREMEIVYSGPAIFVNKFYVTVGGAFARIAFCEQRANAEPQFRSAVTLSVEDMLKLRDLLAGLSVTAVAIPIPKPDKDNG